MNLVDRVNRERSLTAISRTRRSGRIAANGGVPTTTYSYDSDGNLVQAGGWSYMWDYLNRMLASGYNNSTTTYAYDEFGSRVMQTSTTSTTYYPNKYFSTMSTIVGSTTYATSTNYIWNGDTLLATIDQKLVNGTATGTPITRFIHPDHLGSTNAVTDQNGALVQLLDYYPYGATRVSTSTYPTNEKRQYIGQYSDTSGLSYLNARYYSPTQGQFLSEDPVFWGTQNIMDPQALNAYSYAENNPIVKKDPSGRCPQCLLGAGAAMAAQYGYDVFNNYLRNGLTASDFYTGLSSPQTYLVRAGQGAIIGATGGLAGAEYFGSSIFVQSAVMGATSGAIGAGANVLTGDAVTPQSVFWDTTLGALSFGLAELTPGVRGALPKFGTNAFYFGAHTQTNALALGVDAQFGFLGSILTDLTTPQSRSVFTTSYNNAMAGAAKGNSGASSGGGSSMPAANSLWTTPSGAVVTWGGSLVAGPVANSTPQTK